MSFLKFLAHAAFVTSNEMDGHSPILHGYSLKSVDYDVVDDITVWRGSSMHDKFLEFLRAEQVGVYAYSVNSHQVVGHAWAIRNVAEETRTVNGYFPLPPHSALIHYCRVDESRQGDGIFGEMLIHLIQQLLRQHVGIQRVYIDAATANRASVKAISRVGFCRIGTLRMLQYRGRYMLISSPFLLSNSRSGLRSWFTKP